MNWAKKASSDPWCDPVLTSAFHPNEDPMWILENTQGCFEFVYGDFNPTDVPAMEIACWVTLYRKDDNGVYQQDEVLSQQVQVETDGSGTVYLTWTSASVPPSKRRLEYKFHMWAAYTNGVPSNVVILDYEDYFLIEK